jgi:Family of unknown function (DUF5682)
MSSSSHDPGSQNGGADVHVFGVRHLSPSGAWHLRAFLDRVQPDVVLIEGMSDTVDLVGDIVRRGSEPPIAILAYTEEFPVRTMIYPLAEYSPEYQAMCWAKSHKRPVELIDLPSDVFLALSTVSPMNEQANEGDDEGPQTADELGGKTDSEDAASDDEEEAAEMALEFPEPPRDSIYTKVARQAGEPDYDSFWERSFEHNTASDSYRLGALELGKALREMEEDAPLWRAENLVREAYMRRRIRQVVARGVDPRKIVAIVGAYHAPVLGMDLPAMSDEELLSLPRRPSKLTLMPYSYFRLSSQSGYGAGNHAPAYFQLMWDALDGEGLHELPARYLSMVARNLREIGTHRSTAEIIEGVRLAKTLSALHGGLAPTLGDLRDAAITLIGHGHASVVSEAIARVDVGTAIGKLPKGVAKTSIQDDFDRLLDALKLHKYRTTVKQDLVLDLRENRRAKTPEAAYLDLRRSSFLHRLRVLGVSFAEAVKSGQDSATWREAWQVRWTPESEIELVEAVLLGETIELAVGYKFKTILERCTSVAEAAKVVLDACVCGLMEAMELGRKRLQELSTETSELRAVASAANQLGMIARYGDVRKFDSAPLLPLIADLFVQGALALVGAANCDDDAARHNVVAMDELNKVNLEYHELVDEELWVGELQRLADADDKNPLLSGYACAILLERNLVSNDDLSREVSRRISPGIDADIGAGWFEGLAKRNRYALIARQLLWQQLADYVASLDEEQFRRAIVFLRRAFGGFSPQEKHQITENLGEHWGVNPDTAAELLNEELSEQEEEALDELNEFDFGDL